MSRKIPVVTLIVVSLSAIIFVLPVGPQLIYDRGAILNGEWWRVVTGHWVHFSSEHFLYDTAAFGIAGWMIESRRQRNFGGLCVLATIVISAAMLLFNPQLQVCGGLSGLAIAAVVFLALNGLGEGGAWSWICGVALVLCSAKLAVELLTGQFFVLHTPADVALVPSNHIAGALTALAVYFWPKLVRRHSSFKTASGIEYFHPSP